MQIHHRKEGLDRTYLEELEGSHDQDSKSCLQAWSMLSTIPRSQVTSSKDHPFSH